MLTEVWSGGQAGADIAGLRAAKAVGLATGGFIPRGFRTEAGPRPEYAELYGLVETKAHDYPPRTKFNVQNTDATFLIGDDLQSPGMRLTKNACTGYGEPYKPYYCQTVRSISRATCYGDQLAADFLRRHNVQRLNVAGNRDADEAIVQAWLERVFRLAMAMKGGV